MKMRCWLNFAGGAAACLLVLTLVAGCGEETPPPVKPPDRPAAPAAGTTETGMAGMAGMSGAPAVAPAAGAAAMMAAPVKVFACTHCMKFSPTAADCPACKMKMGELAVANPDPTVCVASGDKIKEKPSYTIVNDKLYALCCADCEAALKKDPAAVIKKAEDLAKTK